MNKKLIAIIIASVVVVGGGAGAITYGVHSSNVKKEASLDNKKNETRNNESENEDSTVENTEENVEGTETSADKKNENKKTEDKKSSKNEKSSDSKKSASVDKKSTSSDEKKTTTSSSDSSSKKTPSSSSSSSPSSSSSSNNKPIYTGIDTSEGKCTHIYSSGKTEKIKCKTTSKKVTVTDMEARDVYVDQYATAPYGSCLNCNFWSYSSSESKAHREATGHTTASTPADTNLTATVGAPKVLKHEDAITHDEMVYTYTCPECGKTATKNEWLSNN